MQVVVPGSCQRVEEVVKPGHALSDTSGTQAEAGSEVTGQAGSVLGWQQSSRISRRKQGPKQAGSVQAESRDIKGKPGRVNGTGNRIQVTR